MPKGPLYFDSEPDVPRCRWCEEKIDEKDDLGMETGYCSSECYEKSAGDDE
jgi:hypothetical protein